MSKHSHSHRSTGSVSDRSNAHAIKLSSRNLAMMNEFNLNKFFEHTPGNGHEHEEFSDENVWVFHFLDIIYVATIYNISHLMSYCGEDYKVFTIAAAYFAMMFHSRTLFDIFTSMFNAKGIFHTILFMFYGCSVFVMTLNITFVTSYHHEDAQFGHCEQHADYNTAFAAAFIITRLLLFVLYGLYCVVFGNQDIEVPENGASSHGSITSAKYSAEEMASNKKKAFVWKLFPLLLSSGVMISIFYGHDAVTVYAVGKHLVLFYYLSHYYYLMLCSCVN